MYSKNLFSIFSVGVWKDKFKIFSFNKLLHFEIISIYCNSTMLYFNNLVASFCIMYSFVLFCFVFSILADVNDLSRGYLKFVIILCKGMCK